VRLEPLLHRSLPGVGTPRTGAKTGHSGPSGGPEMRYTRLQDAKWPGMYRLVRPDGTLSDMVNLARAKDAVREHGRRASICHMILGS